MSRAKNLLVYQRIDNLTKHGLVSSRNIIMDLAEDFLLVRKYIERLSDEELLEVATTKNRDEILREANEVMFERQEHAGSVLVSENPRTVEQLFIDIRREPCYVRWIGVLDSGDRFFWDARESWHQEMAYRLGVGGDVPQDPRYIPGHAELFHTGGTRWWKVDCTWNREHRNWPYELQRPITQHRNFNKIMNRVKRMFDEDI